MKIPALLFLCVFLVAFGEAARGAESEMTQAMADRYEQMLVRSPQPGSSFDRVVEWYSTQGGGLEVLQKKWAAVGPDDTKRSSYLLLQGMLAERLRNPAQARASYQEALAAGADPAQAARLLATLETTEGNFAAAASAYAKALEGDSLAPVDRMELMRSLALLYQRSFDHEKAVGVWRDALKRFPDDPFVLEEAGEAFLTAGDYAGAREAFTRLSELSGADPYKRVAASLRLARTAELEGKTDEAVAIYDAALEQTSQGSWINREVRARIEELFRRKDDLPGLLAYYEKRTDAAPQDFQAIAAQAQVLEDLGRSGEAIDRLRAATKLAPDNEGLRLTLIRRLAGQARSDEALQEAEELTRPANASVDSLVALGNLSWTRFEAKNDAADRERALAAWHRIAPADSTDAARIAQLAEILAARGQTDAALAQWQRLIALAPTAADARQKAAEILRDRGEEKAAQEILAALVEGDRAQPENFLTLARIEEKMDWPDRARSTAAAGLAVFPDDYELLSLAWRQALEAKDAAAAKKLFLRVWELAPNEFFAEDAAKRYASFLDTDGKGAEIAKELAARSDLSPADAAVLLRLALSLRDQSLAAPAVAALEKAGPALRAARARAEVAQAFGTKEEQIAALRVVASADPRMAAESLRVVARLQAESGQVDEALATVRQLIERSPADATLYTLYADLASRAGRLDLAIQQLRGAIRHVENATNLRLQMAAFLQAQENTDEAAKVLQEAFEREDQEGRRLDIFRRQVELAMQSGQLDALVASLKEKQTREQNGARYGVYLAEIAMQQGDFREAQEQLTRSLGRNPDNAAAVGKLLDLADRGGNQEEGLRLAARLAELQPSRENRAAYLSRLFESGEDEQAMEAFELARPEIVKDPAAWSAVLTSMRKAGHDAECDRLIEELALSQTGAGPRLELAQFRLLQRDYAAADKELWEIVRREGLGDSLSAIAEEKTGVNLPPGLSIFRAGFAPFQRLSQEVLNGLQQMYFRNSRRGMFFMGPLSASTSQATPDQRAQVRALLLLGHLARAHYRQEEFSAELNRVFEQAAVPREQRIMIMATLNDQRSLRKMAREQADDPQGDPEVDKFLISSGALQGDENKELLDALTARVDQADPKFGFQLLWAKSAAEFAREDKARQRALLDTMLAHPGLAGNALGHYQVAASAAIHGDLDLACRLLAEADQLRQREKDDGTPSQVRDLQLQTWRLAVLARAIQAGDPRAGAQFTDLLATLPANGAFPGQPVFSSYGYGRSFSPLAQPSMELGVGDSQFSFATFQALLAANPAVNADSLGAWFRKQAKKGEFDAYEAGAFYAAWVAGRKEEGIRRLEEIAKAHPSARVQALLLEAYEKSNDPGKALALIDEAELQRTETTEVRTLRKIRLLRALSRTDEARALAEKAARTNVSSSTRDFLANELSQLGVQATQYPNLVAFSNRSRRSMDRSSQIGDQIDRLVRDKKVDEAERMAVSLLQRPLPRRDDYQEVNLRWRLVQSLRSMKRTAGLETTLLEALARDPSDVESAIRLVELASDDASGPTFDRLVKALTEHPQKTRNLSYVLQLAQRRNEGRVKVMEVICASLKANPDYVLAELPQMRELLSIANDNESSLLLAETVAGMSDEHYEKLFLFSRLTGQMEESMVLSQLAETALQSGKPDLALRLLGRALPDAGNNLAQGLPVFLRLTELQLAQDRREEAVKTMKTLIESKPSTPYFYGNAASLGNILSSSVFNRMSGNRADNQLARLARLSDQTGTTELLLATVDTQGRAPGQSASPSLLLRTMMERPEVGAEWKSIVQSSKIPPEYLNIWFVPVIVKLLATQPEAAKLIPAYLKKIPEAQFGAGGAEYALACLTDTLPLVAKYRSDPAIDRYVRLLVAKVASDPNTSQYLLFTQSYGPALFALMENGFVLEARQLYEISASARANRNSGYNRGVFDRVEARLRLAQNDSVAVQVLCAGFPVGEDRLRIQWKLALNTGASNPDWPTWDDAEVSAPKKSRPVSLEIHAGRNAAVLRKVGSVANPGSSGSLEVKGLGPIGLLQARWKLADGSEQWGPLSAYLQGRNLIKRNGVPERTDALGQEFERKRQSPLGKDSAVTFTGNLARPEIKVPLGGIELDGSPRLIAFSGWFRGEEVNGNMPGIAAEIVKEGGRTENDDRYLNQAMGEWRQFFQLWNTGEDRDGVRSLPKDARQLILRLQLRASSGYNSLYSFNTTWDGLQLVSFTDDSGRKAAELMAASRKEIQAKNYGGAADLLSQAFRLNPLDVVNRGSMNLIDVYKKAGRLGELFEMLSAPALYLPDPLRQTQPVIRNEGLLRDLVREALAADAPSSARQWLRTAQNVPLQDSLRFVVEAAILRDQIAQDPAKATPDRLLSALGLSPEGADLSRVQLVWSGSAAGSPAMQILDLIDQKNLNAEVGKKLGEVKPSPDVPAASLKMLEAWVLAPVEPLKALDLWRQAIENGSMPGGRRVRNDTDQSFVIRLAGYHPSPGDFVAAVKAWLAKDNDDAEQQRRLMEILYAAAKGNSPGSKEYGVLWARAETAALRSPTYSPSRDRVRELASRLVAAQDWASLDELLALSETNPSLKGSALQEEFAQLRKLAALARGRLDEAWPVAWCKPGTNSRRVEVYWQWNIKDQDYERGRFDDVIGVSKTPLLEKIPGQQAVEIFFGELPSELKQVASFEGDAAQGSVPVELPGSNGFVRAVAVVGGQRHAGPLLPVLAGRRVYPADGGSLAALLASGKNPVESQNLGAVGDAPDGSPAFRIGAPGAGGIINYEGPTFPVQPQKFYVVRAWQRRAGDGSGSLGTVYQGKPSPSGRDNLNMLVSENGGSTGPWVLYTRAVPSFPQHTFWINYLAIEGMTPIFGVPAGTEIAGWELLEIDDWKYGKWIGELAMLRQEAGAAPGAEAVRRAAELAAIEPLTALDYHGEWLAREMVNHGMGAQAVELFRTAFSAEANPLFSRPKLGRIFNYFVALINNPALPDDVRWAGVQLGRENLSRASAPVWCGVQAQYLVEARKHGEGDAALAAVRADLEKKLTGEAAAGFLKSAVANRTLREGRPVSHLVTLAALVQDEKLAASLRKGIEQAGLEASDKEFILLALAAADPQTTIDDGWQVSVNRAFNLMSNTSSFNTSMAGPMVLGDLLAARQAPPALVIQARKQAFDRMLMAKEDQSNSAEELARSGWLLIETSLAQNNREAAGKAADHLATALQVRTKRPGDEPLRSVLRALDALSAAGMEMESKALFESVEKDVRRSSNLAEPYAKYLKTGTPSPTPGEGRKE